jgi:hypothetical protein
MKGFNQWFDKGAWFIYEIVTTGVGNGIGTGIL